MFYILLLWRSCITSRFLWLVKNWYRRCDRKHIWQTPFCYTSLWYIGTWKINNCGCERFLNFYQVRAFRLCIPAIHPHLHNSSDSFQPLDVRAHCRQYLSVYHAQWWFHFLGPLVIFEYEIWTLYSLSFNLRYLRGRRGNDRMVVAFTTTYAISAYNRSLTLWVRIPLKRGVLNTTLCDKVCQSVLWQVVGFPLVLRFPPPIKWIAPILLKYCWKWR